MPQSYLKKHERFWNEGNAHVKEMGQILEQRKARMKHEWEDVEDGRQQLERQNTESGMVANSTSEGDTWVLNVGGSYEMSRSELEGPCCANSTLANLFESDWDKRLPRDADGKIVLDESPACVEHLVNPLGYGLPVHEKPYLAYVTHTLGLSAAAGPPSAPHACRESMMEPVGGSTVLGSDEFGRLMAGVLGWCPGKAAGVELIFRSSRDGDLRSILSQDNGPSTITLYRLKAQGTETTDSVIGGFSSVPLVSRTYNLPRPGTFLFMLKDGNINGVHQFQPVRWGARGGCKVFVYVALNGPRFGGLFHCDLGQDQSRPGVDSGVTTANKTFDIPNGSPYLSLNKRKVVDYEVFRVLGCPNGQTGISSVPSPDHSGSTPSFQRRRSLHNVRGERRERFVSGSGLAPYTAATPETAACSRCIGTGLDNRHAETATAAMSVKEYEDDLHRFGFSIAETLKRERAALTTAQSELLTATAKAEASVEALAAVYGPDVAAGIEDPVVELSIREPRITTRVTTLLSTLLICPELSFFAANFDENRFPTSERSMDPHRRQLIDDCRGSDFSKILDVLRMKKRAAWAGSETQQAKNGAVRVTVKAADRASFETCVNKYFPGCESFILDSVKFL